MIVYLLNNPANAISSYKHKWQINNAPIRQHLAIIFIQKHCIIFIFIVLLNPCCFFHKSCYNKTNYRITNLNAIIKANTAFINASPKNEDDPKGQSSFCILLHFISCCILFQMFMDESHQRRADAFRKPQSVSDPLFRIISLKLL